MKISIAQLKRHLPVGQEFNAEFIGAVNIRVFGNKGVTDLKLSQEELVTKRRVEKQSSEMASRILTGPDKDKLIYLTWKGIEARLESYPEQKDFVILTHKENKEDFLKITFD